MESLFDHLEPEKKTYTVGEITRKIKSLLEGEFKTVTVVGEVSRPVYHSSGHVYLTLKDSDAQLSAACFRNVARRLRFTLEQGMEVMATGRISVYEPRGNYQLIISSVEPKGVGALQIAFEQLRKKLEEEGLFEEERKKPIPFLPRTIGIVTSPTGAAIRDMLNIINRRFPDVHVLLYPVRVQGGGAAGEIAAAINNFNAHPELGAEVLIVGRGGGSIEDLWAFNEEVVARAIAASDIPVVSAVGHEIDFTISDFVADVRAETPSAAAEIVLPERGKLVDGLKNYRRRLALALKNLVRDNRIQVFRIYDSWAFRKFGERLLERGQRLDDLARYVGRDAKNTAVFAREKIATSAARLDGLSPLAVLGRGYSYTTGPDGRAVLNADTLAVGDVMATRLARGSVKSRMEEVLNDG